MELHANAPLGLMGRAVMTRRVVDDGSTAGKWVRRYRAEGRACLTTAPLPPPSTTPLHPTASRQLDGGVDAGEALAPLQQADLGSVKGGPVAQLRLRQPGPLAAALQVLSEADLHLGGRGRDRGHSPTSHSARRLSPITKKPGTGQTGRSGRCSRGFCAYRRGTRAPLGRGRPAGAGGARQGRSVCSAQTRRPVRRRCRPAAPRALGQRPRVAQIDNPFPCSECLA
jgi:hypothetical protein